VGDGGEDGGGGAVPPNELVLEVLSNWVFF